ncbi:MAG: hypothetical protein A3I09_01330 [Deltaproteobacteria bacterium RIFCSPLOWO2_02_FULL_47_10]|nr:MAG: hypothetical protein A3I09_01330 [Deltaproteobacteria bacterium RIFCSPLOWO2_02_FULL_47_10]
MILVLIPIFFAISVLYSAVGLGGGSAYIAAMVIFGVSRDVLPIAALGCNLIVAATSFVRYRQAGFFRWNIFLRFGIASMPFAYIGGILDVPDRVFTVILTSSLALAAIRLLFWKDTEIKGVGRLLGGHISQVVHLAIGAVLGLVAGITGIGGGIYLIPVLILLKIASPKEASAVASLFIVVNSMSGLIGHASRGYFDLNMFLPLAGVVFLGGLIGSKIGTVRLRGEAIQKVVGVILFIAIARLIGIF